MTSLKAQAERLRLGIVGGWLPVSDAVAWADSLIAASCDPPPELLDISLFGHRPRDQVVKCLAAIPGATDSIPLLRSTLRDLRAWMGADPEKGEQVAKYLYSLATAGELPEVPFGPEPFLLDDHFTLARSGTFGTLAEAHSYLTEWLAAHAGNEA